MRTVAFRVDASLVIGSGHLMRCLVLAHALHTKGVNVYFICRNLAKEFQIQIQSAGFFFHSLPFHQEIVADETYAAWLGVTQETDAMATVTLLASLPPIDWLIVDHYGIDARWEKKLKGSVRKMMVIDDLANRSHDCDALIDQNLYKTLETRYQGYVTSNTRLFLGPQYALLRPEFSAARQYGQGIRQEVKRINICFGGLDASGETLNALKTLEPILQKEVQIDVILGMAAPCREAIEAWVKTHENITLHLSPGHVADILARADLAIGASGSMTWERACLGLPSITYSLADNQKQLGIDAAHTGIHLYLGERESCSPQSLKSAVACLMENVYIRETLHNNSRRLVDGEGARRITQFLLAPSIQLREAQRKDCENIYHWRNNIKSRRYAHSAHELLYSEHQCWFEKSLQADDGFLLIAEDEEGALGVLRFDDQTNHWLISIYLVPHRHGQGLGTPMLRAGIDWLQARLHTPTVIKAEIQPENIASQRAFEQVGFKKECLTYNIEVIPA